MDRTEPSRRILFILAAGLLALAPLLQGQSQRSIRIAPGLAGFTAHLDRRVPSLLRKYAIPGVNIALIQKGRTTWSKAYGYADLAEARPMTAGTLLMAQSISKSVTAWGVMKLVEEGKLGLDVPVTGYLTRWHFPPSEFPVDQVTIRRLLSLSAGLPLGDFSSQYAPGDETPPLQETLSAEHTRLVRRPGSAFAYSNTSYALLELLIEEVTGRDFTEYMQDEILTPLGMKDSSFAWRDEYRARIATGYDLRGRPIAPYVYPYHASGGLYATVGDLARFVCAGMTTPGKPAPGRPLTRASLEQLYRPNVGVRGMFGVVSDAYGLGHFVESLGRDRRAVWHGGQGNGWMTHFHLVPETGDGIVILTNSQRSWPFFSIVLSDWAKWNGFGQVGMGRISQAEPAMQSLIGLLFLASVWQAWRLGRGLTVGRRRFAPLAPEARLLRLAQSGGSAALAGVFAWSLSQEYLFLDSIFPTLSRWLGLALLSVAVTLLASACLPPADPPRRSHLTEAAIR